jgi:hypothetical protein
MHFRRMPSAGDAMLGLALLMRQNKFIEANQEDKLVVNETKRIILCPLILNGRHGQSVRCQL